MAKLSSKLRSVSFNLDKTRIGIAFWCPGCDESHAIVIKGNPPIWNWDGNIDYPTISQSIKVMTKSSICHFFLKQGKLQFLNDCTHNLKGQIVNLPDWNLNKEENFYLDSPHDDVKLND